MGCGSSKLAEEGKAVVKNGDAPVNPVQTVAKPAPELITTNGLNGVAHGTVETIPPPLHAVNGEATAPLVPVSAPTATANGISATADAAEVDDLARDSYSTAKGDDDEANMYGEDEEEEMEELRAPSFVGAPIPYNEEERMNTLHSCKILDTPGDPVFDDITKLVCKIFNVPIAIVSLVDRERQWFKSVQGLSCQSTDRKSSFCAWTLLPVNPEVLVVQDALLDGRFRDNPLVTNDPFIRFYAGCPLVSANGLRLGSLCVIDRKPRQFDAESCNLLANFSEVAVREIEKEKTRVSQSFRLAAHTNGLLRAMDCFTEGIMLVDTSKAHGRWTVMFINDAFTRMTGVTREQALGKVLWDIFALPDSDSDDALEVYQETVKRLVEFTMDLTLMSPSGDASQFTANFRPGTTENLDGHMPSIGIPGLVDISEHVSNTYFFATVQEKRLSQADATHRWRPLCKLPQKEPFEDVQLGPLLGQGAFGRVYRGIWNGAPVAVKIMQHPEPDQDRLEETGGQGVLEAMLGTDLAHPSIVQTFKTATRPLTNDDHSGRPTETDMIETWLVLEFCDKGSLQDAVDKGWFRTNAPGVPFNHCPPDMARIKNTAREIAAAMTYLHSMDILHGDLTGGNILLVSSTKDSRGFVSKVADFGLSRIMNDGTISTGTYGTVTHMPPELLTTGHLSKSADVYAFGVLLWEMYTGQRPWAGLLQMQVIFHVTIQRKRLEFPPGTPAAFKELAYKCLSPEPENRPKFEEVIHLLDRVPPLEDGMM